MQIKVFFVRITFFCLCCFVACLFSCATYSGAEEVPSSYAPMKHDVAFMFVPNSIDERCFSWLGTCTFSSEKAFALEQEFWSYLGNGNTEGMRSWDRLAAVYIRNARPMSDKHKSRLVMLRSFAHVYLYVQGNVFNPLNILNAVQALRLSTKAYRLYPDNANIQTLHFYLQTFLIFSTFRKNQGFESIDKLYGITERYGPVIGSEGVLVGAMSQLLLRDIEQVREGLAALNDCNTTACRRNSSIAPFKELGMQIAIGEGYARLGDLESMERAFKRARAYSEKYKTPYQKLGRPLHC